MPQAAQRYSNRNTAEEGGGGYQGYNWDSASWGTYTILSQILGSTSEYPTKVHGLARPEGHARLSGCAQNAACTFQRKKSRCRWTHLEEVRLRKAKDETPGHTKMSNDVEPVSNSLSVSETLPFYHLCDFHVLSCTPSGSRISGGVGPGLCCRLLHSCGAGVLVAVGRSSAHFQRSPHSCRLRQLDRRSASRLRAARRRSLPIAWCPHLQRRVVRREEGQDRLARHPRGFLLTRPSPEQAVTRRPRVGTLAGPGGRSATCWETAAAATLSALATTRPPMRTTGGHRAPPKPQRVLTTPCATTERTRCRRRIPTCCTAPSSEVCFVSSLHFQPRLCSIIRESALSLTACTAVAAGPGQDDSYADLRSDYQKNEVALDYNAGFQGEFPPLFSLATCSVAQNSCKMRRAQPTVFRTPLQNL